MREEGTTSDIYNAPYTCGTCHAIPFKGDRYCYRCGAPLKEANRLQQLTSYADDCRKLNGDIAAANRVLTALNEMRSVISDTYFRGKTCGIMDRTISFGRLLDKYKDDVTIVLAEWEYCIKKKRSAWRNDLGSGTLGYNEPENKFCLGCAYLYTPILDERCSGYNVSESTKEK